MNLTDLSPEELQAVADRVLSTLRPNAQKRNEIRRCGLKSAPLSFAQERLWFLEQLGLVGTAYNVHTALRLTGPLDEVALERSFSEIVRRHESLRTRFELRDWEGIQIVDSHDDFAVVREDLSDKPEELREPEVERCIHDEATRKFDLKSGSPFRVKLLKLAPTQHVLIITMHHIAADSWSIAILIREVSVIYQAYRQGKECPLLDLPLQYADYAVWQRGRLQGEELQRQLNYWKESLRDAPPMLGLPTDRVRPAIPSYRGASHRFTVPAHCSQRLQELARREGATLFMVLVAGFKIVLSRWSGQKDIVIGTSIAGRTHRQLEQLIGLFANTLVLRTDLSHDPSFIELLRQVKDVALGAYAHQDLPFEKLVQELHPQRTLAQQLVFQVMFALQNAPRNEFDLDSIRISPYRSRSQPARFDMACSMGSSDHGLWGAIEYATDLFDESTIRRFASHLSRVLEHIAERPDERLITIHMLSEDERQQVLYDWNATAAEYPAERCVHELFERQAAKTPDAVALVFGEAEVSYKELNARANRLAHWLTDQGVGPDVRVGIAIERSIDMVVALLGTLKAGGAYVPLDPAYPEDRLAFMLRDSDARVLLTQQAVLANFGGIPDGVRVLALDGADQALRGCPDCNPDARAMGLRPERLAYIIYTSGSTGTPKGVMVEHRNIANYLSWAAGFYGSVDAVVSSSLAFDATATSLYLPLLSGRSTSLLPETKEVDGLYDWLLNKQCPGLIKITPSHLEALGQRLKAEGRCGSLPLLVVGGESLSTSTVKLWRELHPGVRVINEYGPTETAVGCVVYDVPAEGPTRDGAIPIGKPIANTRIYILDERGELVPVGVVGEIYIGGTGVARGYLNRPGLTAERFLHDPFAPQEGDAVARMYRTGDLARWLADGNIEFLGRNDHQVKIRGFRVELGEIEARLLEHKAVREAVVLAREDQPGEKRLVAYYTAPEEVGAEQFRDHLAASLPEYMVPWLYVRLPALPLTANGKVDRRALPAPDIAGQMEEGFVAPRNATERMLARIWAEALNLDRVGIHDSFFELGGDSLTAVSLVARSNQAGLSLTVFQVFEHQTIANLASQAELGASERNEQAPLPNPRVTALRHESSDEISAPLSPVQQLSADLWGKQLDLNTTVFAFRYSVPINESALARAVHRLVSRHAALRLAVIRDGSEWRQYLRNDVITTVESRRFAVERIQTASAENWARFAASIDCEKPPLIRVAIVPSEQGASEEVWIVAHHFATDVVSWRVMIRDLERLYLAALEGADDIPQEPGSQFITWVRRLHEYSCTPEFEDALAYWSDLEWSHVSSLRQDAPTSHIRIADTRSHSIELTPEMSQDLIATTHRIRTQVDMLLLTAVGGAVAGWSSSDCAVVELLNHGRAPLFPDLDISETVGWFTTGIPVWIRRRTGNAQDAVRDIHQQLARAPGHGLSYWLGLIQPKRGLLQTRPSPLVCLNHLGGGIGVGSQGVLSPVQRVAQPAQLPRRFRDLDARSRHLLKFETIFSGQRLRLIASFNGNAYREASIAGLCDQVVAELEQMIRLL